VLAEELLSLTLRHARQFADEGHALARKQSIGRSRIRIRHRD
jgi:hypothetical protein